MPPARARAPRTDGLQAPEPRPPSLEPWPRAETRPGVRVRAGVRAVGGARGISGGRRGCGAGWRADRVGIAGPRGLR